jgi:hypothetical protein
MANSSDSSTSDQKPAAPTVQSGWLKVTAIAAASALAGGLAAAWWHRKTLAKFRQGNENPSNPDFRISPRDPTDEL